jgi:hypothetical protein
MLLAANFLAVIALRSSLSCLFDTVRGARVSEVDRSIIGTSFFAFGAGLSALVPALSPGQFGVHKSLAED